ncbi:MAG: glycosyltransferase N-terminal domain-containing protein [Pseudomonadota bacterium]
MLPDGALHQYVPVDTAGAVGRFLDHWSPDLALWVESELWPRLVAETAGRGVPMALVNARLSAGSARNWSRAPGMIAALLGCFRRIVTQDAATAGRITDLRGSGEGVRIGGNLKALAPLPAPTGAVLSAARAAIAGRAVWLAASTHPGEEEVVLDAHLALGRAALLILVPRHPDRADAVAALCAARGLAVARASAGALPDPTVRVWLGDTLGQMGLWLRLARVAFIGGSLAEKGGHTPFEPAMLDTAILHGPHVANFAPAYAALDKAGGALAVDDAESLAAGVARLIEDTGAQDELTARARVLFDDVPDPDALAREMLALAEGG